MRRVTWLEKVRGANLRLQQEAKRIEAWRGFWMAPFYAWLRRSVLHKEDAWSVAERKLNTLLMRHDRIARRYGR
ncbi:hypothetical protein BLA39750_01276 [Burkholderia lata]|uniref:Transposase n=1 Tax=Burkholderia lata (strain ATCC 17760 / DSM 23089 / LMG 22485 / NCIMB 9086 / R18194 / 383) TaxID=482957 RepID=A0A6P2V1V3_BURL3|nr:hypothetical protein BLA39750_01276 [Burkholderia lata]